MIRMRTLALLSALCVPAGCTADPNAPVNQMFPIKQMDDFFRPITGSPAPAPAYTREPGYAPAYPPYSSNPD